MADESRFYNGAAAYDVFTIQANSAQPLSQPQQLPEERPVPQRKTRVKVKTEVSPFAIFGMAAVACLLVLVIFGYVQLFEATNRVSKLEYRLQTLTEEQAILQSKYSGKVDMDTIRARATEMGLRTPTASQIVYVNLTGSDHAEIYEVEKSSLLGEIFAAMRESVSEMIAYLHPAEA